MSQIYIKVQKIQPVCRSEHTLACVSCVMPVVCISIISEWSCFQAPQRFAKIARGIRTVVRIHISMKRYLKEESNPTWSLLEMTLNLRNHFDKILSFRPTEQWV